MMGVDNGVRVTECARLTEGVYESVVDSWMYLAWLNRSQGLCGSAGGSLGCSRAAADKPEPGESGN